MSQERPYDIVLFGATGFTGRLTAEYLARRAAERPFAWAIAGRNTERLAGVRDGLQKTVPSAALPSMIEASVDEPATLAAMAAQTRVVATTVGPYQRYGRPVVQAAVEAGCDYVDITGEPEFVADILKNHDDEAREKGLRIVNCCGFDSIPHDLGAWIAVRELGADEPIHLEGFVRSNATFSGGTWQSAVEAMGRMRQASKSGGAAKRRRVEGDRRVRGTRQKVRYEKDLGTWVAPMPTIDPLVVLRSARALPEYGPDFRYGHYMQVRSFPGLVVGALSVGSIFALAQLPPTRRLLLSYRQSGEGPSEEKREKSRFRVIFLGSSGKRRVRVEVSGGDPGYTETSKMLAESALTLAHDRGQLGATGVVTTAVAMGEPLLERLRRAGMRFEVMDRA
jgi:short subunit dehydrogenase-like uncharacterized protein